MDPETFSTTLYKWDIRGVLPPPPNRFFEQMVPPSPPPPPPPAFPPLYSSSRVRDLAGLEDFFNPYGIRYQTTAKLAELGFTVSTLVDMRDEELDDMMVSLSQVFRWDLLVGEKYGIKAAIRAERRRLYHLHGHVNNPLDALSQEGLTEEPVQQQEREAAGSGGGGTWDVIPATQKSKIKKTKKKRVVKRKSGAMSGDGDEEEDNDDDDDNEYNDGRGGRQREHPFIVTEPGEVARGKKNGLDYLFHLYEQCHQFLIQVQNIAKDRGEKCPIKVTNQVFRYAIEAGATYINKPKIRHYVHCYALHCLDEKTSNELRKAYKERGEKVGVGAWRQACYEPLVRLAGSNGWDIDALFNGDPRLSVWYVPPKLRKLCHAQRSISASAPNSASF